MGPTPHLGPAVHSWGDTALHEAVFRGNRRIVGSLVDANADVNAQNRGGCRGAVCACGESAVSAPACDKPNVYGLTRILKSNFGNSLGMSLMLSLILNGNTGISMDFEKVSIIVSILYPRSRFLPSRSMSPPRHNSYSSHPCRRKKPG